jgi:hypothetical protein
VLVVLDRYFIIITINWIDLNHLFEHCAFVDSPYISLVYKLKYIYIIKIYAGRNEGSLILIKNNETVTFKKTFKIKIITHKYIPVNVNGIFVCSNIIPEDGTPVSKHVSIWYLSRTVY